MQNVAAAETDIKLESEINNGSKVGNSSTPSTPRSPPCSPPCTPPDTPPDRLSDSFQYLTDTSGSGDEDISEVDSFIIDTDELPEETRARLSSKLLLPDEGGERTVDPETQARLQSLLKAAGINKLTAGDGKQLADPEVLRRLTSSVSCALDEAAAALTRMRSDSRQANKRALIKACTQGNVTAVRKLLKQGISVNETSEEGESLLSLACSAGYYELAQVLLAMNASVEDRGSKGDCTPLMEAASAGYVDIVRLLLAHGADVNAQSATGNTPLMYACAGGHVQTVRVLLDADANVEDHNENGHTPLMEAASAGHVEVAKMLLEQGAGINTHSNEFKESALTLACYKGHLEMVNFLLQAGADQEHKTDEMHTALMEASMDGHVEVAKLLLDSGAQVNMPTDSFESPLTLAACGGHVDLAILLIERGANIEEVNDEGYTPLMEAAREGHEDMVAVLLQRGARINAQTEETQETALTLACCGGFIEVADYLIKQGADLELGASTPLMEAAQEGHLELVRYLLEAGANVHAHTQTADTALTYACENGHTDVADLLLQYGAHLEHESEGGRTPLMKACRAGHLCTVQFLVSKNADINRRTTNNDHTPLSLACAGGHFTIVQFLLDHGADMFHKLKDNSTMLIEAAKGGHTNVVQLLLDYPELCSSNMENNMVATSSAATTMTTATATQTCTAVPSCASSDAPKNNVVPARSNTVVSGSNHSITCVNNNGNQKVANGAKQIATAMSKTVVRKSSRDPRLADPRVSDKFQNVDAKKNTTSQENKKIDFYRGDMAKGVKMMVEEARLNQQTLQLQQKQQLQQQFHQQQQLQQQLQQKSPPPQTPPSCAQQHKEQSQQVKQHQDPNSAQLEQQFQDKLTISSAIEQQVMQSQMIVEELQRVEQEMKDNGIGAMVPVSGPSDVNKDPSNCRTVICSVEPLFSNTGSAGNQVTPMNNVNVPTSISNGDNSNLPPPPPLIPISEVLQSTAISDRPKAKPTKKEGKMLRRPNIKQLQQHLIQLQNQQIQQQTLSQPLQAAATSTSASASCSPQNQCATSASSAAVRQMNNHEEQVIKNQQQIEMHQQQQQQQQQLLQQSSQQPQLIGSGTITVATNAPNLADIFNHQELLAQIQQMDSSFAKSFPDFAEKTIEKEMRAMQQMMSCDMLQESLQKCHFLASISEDEVLDLSKIKTAEAELLENMEAFSLEDATNSTITIEEKRLCDVHQHAAATILDGIAKTGDKLPTEKHSFAAANGNQTSVESNPSNLPNLTFDQQTCIQLFTMPGMAECQQSSSKPSTASVSTVSQSAVHLNPSSHQVTSSPNSSKVKPKTTSPSSQPSPKTTQPLQQIPQQQKSKQIQIQKQLLQQQQKLPHHFQTTQKFQPPKQQPTAAAQPANSDSLSLNSQARQELHRHLNEMKAIAQGSAVAAQQNHSTVTKCVADSTVSHAATSTQTTVATIKKKLPFDDAAGALTKLAIGKKMRTVNPRVPPSTNAHMKDDGNNARVPSTNVAFNQNFSMDVDSETESNHDTALTLACAGGHEELVELLLSRGADIEHRDKKGFTPLILAATAGHEKVVDLLLNHNADIEAQSERTRDTPLSLACSGGRYEVVDLLLGRGANKEHRNVSDYTPLSLAASGGYVNIIKLLLSHGAEINSRTGSKLGISPLMLAAMNGHTAAVKLLLDMGSDINAQIETNRNTALTLACFQGRHEVVSLLLERKANVEHRAKTGLTPLMEAASGGYVDVGRVLLEKGADVNAPPVPSSRDTALTIASDKGHVKFVELLITKGALVEVKNKKGNSPMWLAANGGHLQVVELLFKVGADIDSQDNRKVSCLMAAFRKGHVKTVTWMVDRVNQFPSDQEMTRYISTINDKELLDKCQACMKIIRVAKDEQAEKANEYANILLEELDLEKSREEYKRMAAARRKERKKNKKLQKILEKRSQLESENNDNEESPEESKPDEDDVEEEYQASNSNNKKEVKATNKKIETVSSRGSGIKNLEVEEPDSGIDANSLGSCSSNDHKNSSTDRGSSKKRKTETNTVKSSKEEKKKKKAKEKEKKNVVKEPEKLKDKNKKENKKAEPIATAATTSKTSAPKTTETGKTRKPDENKVTIVAEESNKKSKKEAKLVFESSNTKNSQNTDKEDETQGVEQPTKKKKHIFNQEDSTVIVASASISSTSAAGGKNANVVKNFTSSNGKQTTRRSTGANGEEEWKEVVRKCLSPTYRIKKVSVPFQAISRVIGRAGCNINAIRTTTGAHIEIEKIGKNQGERIITIKGTMEATKQAHGLISALIEDPEVDITQILPKPVKASTKGKNVTTSTTTSTTKSTPSTQNAVTSVNATIAFTKTVTVAASTTAGLVVSTATVRTSTNVSRPSTKITTTTYSSYERKSSSSSVAGGTLNTSTTTITVSNSNNSSVPVSNTKTTMSYTSAIMMTSNKAPPKSVSSSPISTTTVVSQTFAAKVSETTAVREKETIIKPPIAPPPPTSTSIFIRPPPIASASPNIAATPNKPPFSMQSQATMSPTIQTIPPLPAQISQQLSHPPPPLPSSVSPVGLSSKLSELQIGTIANEEPSPVSGASEYSLFNDTFSKKSMWGRDDDGSQKGMNFASVVTASGSTSATVGSSNSHTKFLDADPPLQVDASKAPGYRGTSMCSPNLQKPPPPIRSTPSNVTSLSPSGSSLAYASCANSMSEQMAPITAPIARPTSVPTTMDGAGHTFTPRALFHDKTSTLFSREQALKMVQGTSGGSNDSASGLLSQYHSLSYSQPQVTTTVSMSRLNPRAPDFSTTIKPPTVSIPTNQLPPTHQPPPLFNQQSLTANYLSSQHAATVMANSNIMSFPINKYGQSSQRADSTQWSLMNAAAAAAQHSNYNQNDLINFATPTTLNSLIQAQNTDMLAGLENGALNNTLNMSPNSNPTLMAAAAAVGMRSEERKIPPKPIGTERAWRTERERSMPIDDPNSWILDQKISWNPQVYRNSAPPQVTAVQPAPVPTSAPYSRLPQVPDDIRPPVIDGNVYQNDHYNGMVQNPVLPTTLPPLMPHLNIGQAAAAAAAASGPMMQSYNHDVAHPDSYKMESGWDPSRLCISDITINQDKTHHATQHPNWTLSWNH